MIPHLVHSLFKLTVEDMLEICLPWNKNRPVFAFFFSKKVSSRYLIYIVFGAAPFTPYLTPLKFEGGIMVIK